MLRSFTIPFLIALSFLGSFAAQGQVVAGFTLSDTAGCAPLIDHFTNTSTGATSYTWDLGNGTTSTFTDVSGSYNTPGTYTVTLTARNGSTTNVHRATINVYASPTIRFSASDTTVCPNVAAVFTSTVVPGSLGTTTYNWNFGDGSTSTATAPSHAYISAGNYNVTLFATNGKGCINSLSKPSYMHVFTPAAVGFSAVSSHICRGGTATFTNSTVGTSPLSYLWRFYDGYTSALTSPSHTFTSPGVYSISLTATDGHGCIDSFLYTSYMTVGGLSAGFTAVPYGCIKTPITFTNTSSSHLLAGWDFGDGTTALTEDGVHTYTAAGTYPVRLVVYDGTCFDTVFHNIVITHPTGSFSISPTAPCPPPVTMTFNASAPSGCTVSWRSLIFGSLGTGTTLSHSFPTIPVSLGPMVIHYDGFIDSVTMIITDVHGCADTVGRRDTAAVVQMNFFPGEKDTCTPNVVPFSVQTDAVVYDIFAQYPYYEFGLPAPPEVTFPYPSAITSYSWNFGDGSPVSTAAAPTHTYTVVGGVYIVHLTVGTANGCTLSQTMPGSIKVGSPPPMPSFTRAPTRICAGRSINFTSSTSGVFDAYLWHFGDGGYSIAANPSYTYLTPGIFTTDFQLSYNGCKSPAYRKDDTVDAPGAVVYDSFNCVPRNMVTFRDWSIGDDSHLWQFGDGTTSTLNSVVHTFPTVGTYTVTLTTYNSTSGCRDTTHSVMKLANVSAALTAVHPAICKGMPDSLAVDEALAPGDSSWIMQYRWYYNGAFFDSLWSPYPHDTERHVFSTAGINNVRVIVVDNHGCFDTLNTTVTAAKPIDSFSFSPPSGCVPLTVIFTDHSTLTTGTTMSSYYWSFGDGAVGTTSTSTAAHTYVHDGAYSVLSIVTDNVGCSDTFYSASDPVAHQPTANFHAGVPTICAHRSVSFTNTSTGYATSLWFFGDGDTSTATSPTHYYNTAGIYSVTLIVYSAAGCPDTMLISNYIVVNPTPTAAFTMSDSFAVCAPFSVRFTDISSGGTGRLWTFGDGTSSASASATDVYIHPGYYPVTLVEYNSYGCTDTAVRHVNIFGYSGAFTYSPTVGCSSLPVHFTGTFPTVAHVTWDFADGVTSPSVSDTISHIYLSPGMYVPKLILTDTLGCVATSYGADTIKIGTMTAGFTAVPNPVCQHDTVVFRDTSSGGVLPVNTWLWSFGTGATSTVSSPHYAYPVAGTYTVSLTVTTPAGCVGTATKTISVVTIPPAINGPSIACIGSPIYLTDSSVGGTWSSSSSHVTVGSSTGGVTGISAGTALITYSLGSGCTATKMVTVIAGPSPISGGTNLCVGTTITLTDVTPLGTWSSGLPGIATVSPTGLVTGAAPGPDTIYYSVGGCPAWKVVTVNPLAAPITGTTHICMGLTTTLSTTPPGGAWTSSAPSVATIGSSSGILTAHAAGTTTITYTPLSGCFGVTTVFVNSPPDTIRGRLTLCIGGSVALADTPSGGVWTSSNTTVAQIGSLTGTVTGMGAGTAGISYNIGGCIASKTVSVNTLPPPIAGSYHQCVATSTRLSDADTGGVWTSGNPLVAVIDSVSGIITGVAPGFATITYTLGAGCTVTAPITVDPMPTPITGRTYVCRGDTTTLTDPAAGGFWSTSTPSIATVTSGGLVTGITAGLDTIRYTVPTIGCAAVFLMNVIQVPPITGLHPLCAWGDTLTIHDADTTGSYSSSVVTVATVGHGNGLVTTYSSGPATVIYTASTGCYTTATTTINPLPGAITGTMHLCLGGTTTLHDATPGGHWHTTSSIATVDSTTGLVTGSMAGTSIITYVISNGCKVDTSVTFSVPPIVTGISGPNDLCAGQTIVLSDTTAGGTWASSSPSVAGIAGGTVSGISAGTAVISYSVSNACGTSRATHTVNVYAVPSAGVISGPDSICAGTTTLFTNTSTGGTWSTTNPSVTTVSAGGVVTGVNVGADSIVYVVSNVSCSARTSRGVKVKPQPDAGSIAGNTALCLGDTTWLTESVTGGTWSHSNPANNFTTTATASRIKAMVAGVDTVYYAVTNFCGTASADAVVIVGTGPAGAPISGVNVVCEGQTAVFSDPVSGGVWSTSQPAVATINSSGVVSGVTPGTDTVAYLVSNACGSATVYKSITVDPLPAVANITGASTLCVGDSIALSDSTPGGTWSTGDKDISISGSVVVKGISTGTDAVSYSVTNNCGTAVATQAVTVEGLPTGVQITQKGHLLSVPIGYASYQWLFDGKPIAGATTSSYTYTALGNYSVIVSNSFGCSATTPAVYFSDCKVSDIVIYPNPASSIIYIQWCSTVTAKLSADDGRLLEVVDNATQIDVSLLPNAVYTLTLYGEDGHKLLTKRITKLSR